MEIERKFLVEDVPDDLNAHPGAAIEQGYIAASDDGTEVRIRRKDGDAVLTFKQGGGRSRREEELAIEADAFERLWPLTEGARIAKTRYEIPAGEGLTIELDVYAGALEGLVVAEVEFGSDEAADAYEPPGWFGREVTDDADYKNRALAVRGMPRGREVQG